MKGAFVQKNKYGLLPSKVIAVVAALTANMSERLKFEKKKETQQSEQKCTLIFPGIKQTLRFLAVGMRWSTLYSP